MAKFSRFVTKKERRLIWQDIQDQAIKKLVALVFQLAKQEKNVLFGGRLAEYKYYDMAPIVEKVLNLQII